MHEKIMNDLKIHTFHKALKIRSTWNETWMNYSYYLHSNLKAIFVEKILLFKCTYLMYLIFKL